MNAMQPDCILRKWRFFLFHVEETKKTPIAYIAQKNDSRITNPVSKRIHQMGLKNKIEV